MKTTITERAFYIYEAKVYLAESRHRTRHQRRFSFTLLDWAANARRRAMAAARTPQQEALFK